MTTNNTVDLTNILLQYHYNIRAENPSLTQEKVDRWGAGRTREEEEKEKESKPPFM